MRWEWECWLGCGCGRDVRSVSRTERASRLPALDNPSGGSQRGNVSNRRAIFNICGNAYRLVVDLRYDLGRVYVRHIVTHAVYTRLMRRGGL